MCCLYQKQPENDGVLPKTKHDSHFGWMKREEVEKAEKLVVEAFQINKET